MLACFGCGKGPGRSKPDDSGRITAVEESSPSPRGSASVGSSADISDKPLSGRDFSGSSSNEGPWDVCGLSAAPADDESRDGRAGVDSCDRLVNLDRGRSDNPYAQDKPSESANQIKSKQNV
eukprot:scaffold245778_cov31-Prasinocladus_malaysianus.AAC.1